MTTPSFGTIKPALTRLEKAEFVKSQKTLSAGGRPSVYYSITQTGLKELNRLILAEVQDNPVQFLTTARIRLSCAEILNKEEQLNLFKLLKLKSESIIIDIKNILHNENLDFYKKMVMDNLLCEYNNLNSLLEGFERACKN